MATKNQKHLNSIHSDEHDLDEYRKRVATYTDGDTVSFEDENFVTGDSPAVLDVYTNLIGLDGKNRPGHKGFFTNDGPGDIQVEFSADGTNYGGQHTLRGGETLTLNDLTIKKIRLTYVSPTGYRSLIS